MFLADKHIRSLIDTDGLFTDYVDLDTQIQPNGFDLTLASIERIVGAGEINATGKVLPTYEEVPFSEWRRVDGDGNEQIGNFVHLARGPFFIRFNETIKVPNNMLGLARPRSTVIRSGASIHTGVWDAGYEGKSGCLLVVHTDAGLVLEQNARVVQLVLCPLKAVPAALYRGSYHGEGT